MGSRQTSPSAAAAAAGRRQEMLLGKYEIGRLLGRGTFAKVYLARSVSDGAAVAVKILDKAEMVETGMAHSVLTEVAAMRCLSHPNILKLYEVLATRSKIFLVMEHAPGGDLLSRVARRRLPEHAARRYFHQLVSALHYCHARGISHRDVKPQNLLLDCDGNLKISDFGLAALPDRLRDGLLLTACGTPAYTAPEVFRRKGYNGAAADAWSCGVILFVLLAGSLPFDDINLAVMYRRIHRRDYELPPWISPPARRLLGRLLDPNPDTRMTIAQLLDHPWLKRSLSLDSQLDHLSPPTLAAAHAMNAFDIISLSSGLDLSPLFDDAKAKKERRFTSTHTIDKIMDTIQLAGSKLGLVVETEKSAAATATATATAVGDCGSVLSVEVSEILYPILLVEMRLQHDCLGDAAAAEFCWENVRAELGDVVFSWHETEQRGS